MMICDVCRAAMRRFLNEDGTDRWVCPREADHGGVPRKRGDTVRDTRAANKEKKNPGKK
jgi:hypothetical protein